MANTIPEEKSKNYETFRDCLASSVIERLTRPGPKPRRRRKVGKGKAGKSRGAKKAGTGDASGAEMAGAEVEAEREETEEASGANDAEDLAEFIEYIASEIFPSLPEELQSLTHYNWDGIKNSYTLPLTTTDVESLLLPTLDPSIPQSLSTYAITTPQSQPSPQPPTQDLQDLHTFLAPILTAYLSQTTTAPPPPRQTLQNAEGCEICGRDWINLTYHHLIPRMVHDKVRRRGWHREEELQSVAWLCGACHRFVHRFRGHEELAREFYTVERLLAREEVRVWAEWVGRLRWKGR